MTVSGITEITNTQNVIDSREIIERIETLESWRDDPTIGLNEDEARELSVLLALAEEGEDLKDWKYGVTLVRDDHFEDYAQEYAKEIDAVKKDPTWPNNHIDWEAAADELKQDYTSIEFDDVTYWAR